ncbi:N-acetyldiaminopimelate deacetylase [Salibacterium halotolerans]|uniref:N-acetyldiaminopimelate deacetylase n=1 Tax=Salibacterium halotolerans TaxID=1884432 RepID=A0A1I5LXH9_9BACI|nr:N-acetyldiaminopimelate deacetylase [Salibacterium halotolerans]SFP01940.1 N-acetyldiaminopimelate deacetylase [Salibacterium halotolerans]
MTEEELLTLRRQLHQIPEPGFEEWKTQELLLETISGMPQDHLTVRTWRSGIFVYVEGTAPEKTIGYRTDMDGLPMQEQTTLSFPSSHEGYMHACGHDMHMTIAVGILSHFAARQPKDNLLFLFQPAEEGPGGALPMLRSQPFQEWKPDEMYALHVAPEYKAGTVAVKPGLLFANTSELFIDLKGQGGHGARPHTANDMVVAASHLVTQLQTIVSRNVNPMDAAVVTVGTISGGAKQNIIAETARLEGTIRALSAGSMKEVKKRIQSLTAGIETGFDCEISIDWGSAYCQVHNDKALTDAFMQFTSEESAMELVECGEAMTGEDFGYFLEELPGVMFWLGVDTPHGLHDARIEPKEEAIARAVSHMTSFLSRK